MTQALRIAPSILSADFGRLAEEVREVEAAGADWIHIDVMDGCFVPNITLGPDIVQAVKRVTSLPVDVHLMIVDPDRYIDAFVDAGADVLSVHVEAATHLQRTLARIRARGRQAAVALNPHTSETQLEYVLGDLDMVLVMSVNPGFSGQKFLPSQLSKVRQVKALLERDGHSALIQVDGGVSPENVGELVHAGANVVVAGAAVFGHQDRRAAILALRQAAR